MGSHSRDVVNTVAAVERVGTSAGVTRDATRDGVVARIAVNQVRSDRRDDGIVVPAAVERVAADFGEQTILAVITVQDIARGERIKEVVAGAGDQHRRDWRWWSADRHRYR